MRNFAKEETLFSAVEMFEARYDYADVILLERPRKWSNKLGHVKSKRLELLWFER